MSFSATAEDDFQPTYANAPSQVGVRTYRFGYFPHHDPVRLYGFLEPVVQYLNHRAKGFAFRVEVPRDDKEIRAKGVRRELDFFVLSGNNALAFKPLGYRIFAKIGDTPDYRGVIVVRKASKVESTADLKGTTIAFAARTALVSSIASKYVLMQNGLDVDRDAHPKYFSSQDSVLEAVSSGLSRAGGCGLVSWKLFQKEHPELAAKMEVKWETQTFPAPAIIVRDDIPAADVAAVKKALIEMDRTAEGRRLLANLFATKVEDASESSYRAVTAFFQDYRKLFGRDPEAGE